jgi:SAM-dependent methyltransferase
MESDAYQVRHGGQLGTAGAAWGIWAIPEKDLRILGEVRDREVLELGCGAAQWSIALAGQGAHVIGLDFSARQLQHARVAAEQAGGNIRFIHAYAESTPLADASVDIVFSDHGATSFADPYRVLPEVFRVLRPGGIFAFNVASVIATICRDYFGQLGTALVRPYFGLNAVRYDTVVEYALPYGAWVKLIREVGFELVDLIELRPDMGAMTSYTDYASLEWAQQWPVENIWKVRKP